MTYHDDTIAAVASAAQGAARGIVRVSGHQASAVVAKVFQCAKPFDPVDVPRATSVVGAVRIESLELPCRLYFWPTSKSFTGEPVAEFHTIGSPPLLEGLLETLRRAGARMARPGEFTLRAFLAGRIDLTQAEAVLGVIDARSEGELRGALEQLAGGLGGPLRRLRDELLDLLAHLEAGLDFADEKIEFITKQELLDQLDRATATVNTVASRLSDRDVQDALPRLVLVGPPNAGKSSLFNALSQESRALVADIPGTTRDYLTARLDLDGVACELVDTAGLDDELRASPLETASQRQTSMAAQRADVVIVCRDASQASSSAAPEPASSAEHRITVWTKSDLAPDTPRPPKTFATSAVTGAGLTELRAALRALAAEGSTQGATGVRATAARCRGSLDEAATALARARQIAALATSEELVAAELRVALAALGEVVGAVYTNDLLDRIFSRFCIGK